MPTQFLSELLQVHSIKNVERNGVLWAKGHFPDPSEPSRTWPHLKIDTGQEPSAVFIADHDGTERPIENDEYIRRLVRAVSYHKRRNQHVADHMLEELSKAGLTSQTGSRSWLQKIAVLFPIGNPSRHDTGA